MHFDALRTFVTLAEVKNFTKTAERLLMSQPSVSLHIKNLEEELQTTLFLRSPKFLTITPTGELFYDRAKQIISMYEQTKQDILEHHHSIIGTLKIGASFTVGEYILPPFLHKLQRKYPKLELEIMIGNTNEIAQAVQLFQVDIGLIEGQTTNKELNVEPFMQDELFIIASSDHPLACRSEVNISDLQNQTWVTRELGSGTREYLDHVLSTNGLKVKSLLSISSNQGVKETIMSGLGLSLLSYSVIKRDVEQGNLVILPLADAIFTRTLSFLYSPHMRSKKNVDTFINVLQSHTK